MKKEKTIEQKKFEEFYLPDYDIGEEEEMACPDGFTVDEDCGAPSRLGIEMCEFMCPFRRLTGLYELETCYYCDKPIKKGNILCDEHAKEVFL